jgi:hypothetical protein
MGIKPKKGSVASSGAQNSGEWRAGLRQRPEVKKCSRRSYSGRWRNPARHCARAINQTAISPRPDPYPPSV